MLGRKGILYIPPILKTKMEAILYLNLLLALVAINSAQQTSPSAVTPSAGPTSEITIMHDQTAEIKCSDEVDVALDTPSDEVIYWEMPDVPDPALIYPGARWNFIDVSAQGYKLTFESVIRNHQGEYKCYIRKPSGKIAYYTTVVTVKVLSTTDTYRLNIIIGVVAAIVALIICGMIYVLANFSWEKRHQRTDTEPIVNEDDVGKKKIPRAGGEIEEGKFAYFNEAAAKDVEGSHQNGAVDSTTVVESTQV